MKGLLEGRWVWAKLILGRDKVGKLSIAEDGRTHKEANDGVPRDDDIFINKGSPVLFKFRQGYRPINLRTS